MELACRNHQLFKIPKGATLKWILAGVCLYFVSACSNLSDRHSDANEQLSGTGPNSSGWEARGKFIYRSAETREKGNLRWQQFGEQYKITLSGPLGLGTTRIHGDTVRVRILGRAGIDQHTFFPIQDLQELIGIKLPIEVLAKWTKQITENMQKSSATSQRLYPQMLCGEGWTMMIDQPTVFGETSIASNISYKTLNSDLKIVITAWNPL